MSTYLTRKTVVIVAICCLLIGTVSSQAGIEAQSQIEQAAKLARTGKVQEAEAILLPLFEQKGTLIDAGYELGLIYYESNDLNKAVTYFKSALAAAFPSPATGKIQEATDLAKSGKTDESEKILLSLFDEKASAARARYELGLIYESQGKTYESAMQLKNALSVFANNGAEYIGIKTCKKCHLKVYKSWQKTKSANSFENLKPGMIPEIKTNLNLNPEKDYTKDPACLECHTTGYGMPGGYVIPKEGDTKSALRAKNNAGITCEGCHGPGSHYAPVFKEIMTKKRKYTQQELYDVGMFKVDERVCGNCHNQRNPTAVSDEHFDFQKYKDKDTHEHFPLKYRQEE